MGCCDSKDEERGETKPLVREMKAEGLPTSSVMGVPQHGAVTTTSSATRSGQSPSSRKQVSGSYQQRQLQQQAEQEAAKAAAAAVAVVDPAEAVVQRAQHDLINVAFEPSPLAAREGEKRAQEYASRITEISVEPIAGVPSAQPRPSPAVDVPAKPGGVGGSAQQGAADISGTSVPFSADADLVERLADAAATGFGKMEVKSVGQIVTTLPAIPAEEQRQ